MNLPKYAYFRGEIVPYSEARVGVLTHGLNYGTAVFGGMRAYWNEAEEQLLRDSMSKQVQILFWLLQRTLYS